MPKANWGISAGDVDDFDRNDLYTPYQGDIPPNAVYRWIIKKLQYVAATDESVPQFRIGLELKPRNAKEKKYKGYYITKFLYVSDKTKYFYIPFLDALGVSGRDLVNRTIIEEGGNIAKIGPWRNTGDFEIAAQLIDNDPDYVSKNPKKIGWIGEAPERQSDEDDEDSEVDDDADLFDDEDEEETRAPKSRTNGRVKRGPRSTTRRRVSSGRRRRSTVEDEFE